SGESEQDAGRHAGALERRRVGGPVGSRTHAERPMEGRGERADAPEADVQTDLRDRPVRVPEERGRPLHPTHQQVAMGRLAEGAAELAAEVRGREARGAREGRYIKGIAIAGVNEVLRSEEMSGGMRVGHSSASGRK